MVKQIEPLSPLLDGSGRHAHPTSGTIHSLPEEIISEYRLRAEAAAYLYQYEHFAIEPLRPRWVCHFGADPDASGTKAASWVLDHAFTIWHSVGCEQTVTPARIAVAAQTTPTPPRLLDRVRQACRVRHYSIRTEDAYTDWVERFVRFHNIRHPNTMAEPEVNAFLTHLAVDRHVSASTQNQALSALLFLYDAVLGKPLNQLDVIRANRPRRLPVVLSREEVRCVLAELTGVNALIGRILYGTGMRLMECLRLRVKDVDFGLNQFLVREGKGDKDRLTVFPVAVQTEMRDHLRRVKTLHDVD